MSGAAASDIVMHSNHSLVTVLGPTNTGKTHLAIERMLAHSSGMIGLPLRLLAREVYGKVVERVGADAVALITGEEKIKPASPRYYVCTVEAMPGDVEVAFLAIDEIQLAADFDRGHIFTDRLLNRRGTQETVLLGAATIRPLIERLLPGVNVLSRPRLSRLAYAGQTKLTRLPRRSAIVAFSADEVYAVAELIRRQRGGTAVVLGALSPRTRNAQVALYQAGEVDYIVATDAIGMGLNLDIDHVAFAADRKFDGHQHRVLNPAEIGQIAGRAGRHLKDGTFGVTGPVAPFDAELVERLETHRFDPLAMLQWRNDALDFSDLDALKASLAVAPQHPALARAPVADDERALDIVCRDDTLRTLVGGRADTLRLWEVCQVPDYRKIAPANHGELVGSIFRFLQQDGRIPDDWFARQIAYADRTDGDIDTLSNRIAHVRTWTFVANRPDWLGDPAHWQGITRDVEDRLSDALHERLAQRFVDRRTSVLMRRLRDNSDLVLDVAEGRVAVEGHHVGHLAGFHFAPDTTGGGAHDKALRAAALKGLAAEYARRAETLAAAGDAAIALTDEGRIVWAGEEVARLARSDDPLIPRLVLLADEQLQAADRARVQERLERWLKVHVETALAPLAALRAIETASPLVRGLAFRLVEAYGVLERQGVAEEVRGLDQEARRELRALGVRFGAHAIFAPALLKPAAARVTRLLWALRHGGLRPEFLATLPQLALQGLMSVPVDDAVPRGYYGAIGYRVCGRRAVRVDMLERLADAIRPLVAWRAAGDGAAAPEGAHGDGRFAVTPAMMSLVGCSGDDFAEILRWMGFCAEPAPPSAATADSAAAAGPAAATGAGQPGETDGEADAAPALLWRVAQSRPRRNAARHGRGKGRAAAPRKEARRTGRAKTGRPGTAPARGGEAKDKAPARPRREKVADPLSPFAALADLKRSLEAGGGPDGK